LEQEAKGIKQPSPMSGMHNKIETEKNGQKFKIRRRYFGAKTDSLLKYKNPQFHYTSS